jgi:O-antigen ligase
MDPAGALSSGLQEAAAVALAALVAVALLASVARVRAAAVLGLLVLTPAVLVGQVWNSAQFATIRDHSAAAALAALIGAGLLVVAAWALRKKPVVLPALALGVLPFRIPIESGGTTTNLLVPLYLVVAAGALAFIVPALWNEHAEDERDTKPIALALAAFVVLYGLQTLYSDDVTTAVDQLVFFFAPFALLFLILLEVPWTQSTAAWCLGVLTAVALVLVAIGFVEYETRTLLLNPKVIDTNSFSDYFRVNSLFFDPNIYGRFLALVMIGVTTVLLWTRTQRTAIVCAVALAVLWGGLVLTFSQSSFAALLVGLAVLAGLRWKPWPVVAVCAAGVAVALAVVVASPGTVGLKTDSFSSVNQASSGRAKLIRAGLKMARDRPLTGFGSGSFADRYRAREHVISSRLSAESHTIPVTIAAEQGVIGLAAYGFLLWTALAVAFGGLRRTLRRRPAGVVLVGRCIVAAAFCALLLHTFVYAAFLEDPLTWTLLAMAAALRRVERDDAPAEPAVGRAEAVPT